MEPRPQLEKWAAQAAQAGEGATADIDVAKRLLKHGLEALDEIAHLRNELKKANEQTEHFEREWYLRGDAIERAADVARNACDGWNDALMHEGARMAGDAVAALMTPNV